MGWKAIKDHYKIKHTVAVYPGKGICIGSAYVHDLIAIDPHNKTIKPTPMGIASSPDLQRYWDELHDDLETLWKLAEKEDTFENSFPVFTYEDGDVLELQCEKRGWPNVTHDGRLMTDNTFFEKREDAISFGKEDAAYGIEAAQRRIDELRAELAEAEKRKSDEEANLAAMEALG